MAAERKRASSFKIEIPGDTSKKASILSKIHEVKQLNRPVNNGDILDHVLDAFIEQHKCHLDTVPKNTNMATFLQVPKKNVDQNVFMTAESSLSKLVEPLKTMLDSVMATLARTL
ncbi:hypothetical protein KP79_PYT13512 [Mizuhopecten yessoensis]|uniref:Uncharacterized protein n=1 Tax=Mizuhopecten yessoensis TaxID=6573 RepID=A0A210QMC3_MIZYE|nr:hypothetical protein KP79_PYT13512 [Mizuhopecten yessoensis]